MKCVVKSEILFNAQRTETDHTISEMQGQTLTAKEVIERLEDTSDAIGYENFDEVIKEKKLLVKAINKIKQFKDFGLVIARRNGLLYSAAARFFDNIIKVPTQAVDFVNTLTPSGTYSGTIERVIDRVNNKWVSKYSAEDINNSIRKFLGNRLINDNVDYVKKSKDGVITILPILGESINTYEYNRYLNDIGLLAAGAVSLDDNNREEEYDEGTSFLFTPPVVAHINTQLAAARTNIRDMKQQTNYDAGKMVNIQTTIRELEERKADLKNSLTAETLKGYISDILDDMQKNVDSKLHLSNSTLSIYLRSLDLIQNAALPNKTNRILNFSETRDPDLIKALQKFANQAAILEEEINEKAFTAVIEATKERRIGEDFELAEFAKVHNLNTYWSQALLKIVGIQHIQNPIVQFIHKKIADASIASSAISRATNDKIEAVYNKMSKSVKDMSIFYQRDEDDIDTGRLTDVFTSKYWKNSSDFYWDTFTRTNHAITLNPVLLFEKDLSADEKKEAILLRKEINDNLGPYMAEQWLGEAERLWNLYKETEKALLDSKHTTEYVEKWKIANSPIERMARYSDRKTKSTDAFLLVIPKKKDVDGEDLGYYDKNFETIMNNPDAAEFYKEVRNTFISNQLSLQNYREKLKPPTLAYIGQSVIDNVRKGDYQGALRLMGENLKKEYAVKERAVPSKYPKDPITGEYKPHLKFEVHDIPTEVKNRVNRMLKLDAEYQALMKEETVTANIKMGKIRKDFYKKVNIEVEAERSDDLLQSIVMSNYAIQEYIQKEAIETEITLAHHLITHNLVHTKANEDDSEFDNAGQNRLKQAVGHYIDVAFYDIRNQSTVSPLETPDAENPDKKVTTTRGIIHAFMSYGRVAILGWSAKLALLNLGQQAFSSLMKAAEGTDFTFSDLMKAYKDIITNKKDRALVDRLFIAGDLAYTYDKRTIHEQSKLWSALHPMKFQSSAEKINQGATSVAVLHFQRVNEVDKDGKVIKEISLYDALDEEGNLDPKYRHAEYGNLKGLDLLAVITTDKIRPVVMKTSGDYISPLLIEQKEWGKLLTMFKKFLPEMLMDRFHAREYDYSLKRETEGRLYGLAAGIGQIATGRWEEMKGDKVRMAAVRGGIAEVTIALSLRALFMGLAALACDTKECREQRRDVLFGLNILGRLSDDVLELTLPYNMYNNLLNPFAIEGSVKTFARFYGDFTSWVIPGGDDGRYKRRTRTNEEGDLKWTKSAGSLMPFYRTNIYGIQQFSSKLRYDPAVYGWIGFASEIGADTE